MYARSVQINYLLFNDVEVDVVQWYKPDAKLMHASMLYDESMKSVFFPQTYED